ncbi:MAG: PaaI family thioesterase [Polyangiaceae bacterium]|nr:PaaI family thioesterase [Polyangiaceae bacterium]
MKPRPPESGTESLQDLYAPKNQCFGCGPANDKGLRIKSFVVGDEVIADFVAEPHHQAFGGVLNGGIIGALLDCHSNWTAAYHLMKAKGLETPPCTVTSEFHVKLRRPTPLAGPIHIKAHVVESEGDKAIVDASLMAEGKETATCRGVFVAVREGHPAYHRW